MNTFLTRLTFTALLLASLPSSAITISASPSPSTVTVGSSVSVAISISGLVTGSAPSLGTFDLDLGFDTGILSYTGTVFGDPVLGDQLDLFGLGSVSQAAYSTGKVTFFDVSFDTPSDLDSLQADSFTLATLTFDAIATGTSPLSLTNNALGDANGDALTADISNSTLTVTKRNDVPEPAIWLLYSIGMLVMGLLRRGPRGTGYVPETGRVL